MSEVVKLPIWVINLKRDTSRRSFMAEQLERLGLVYEFTDAEDGSELTEKDFVSYDSKLANETINRELTNNEIGCALSHRRLWERIIAENLTEVLILEDDILLGEELLNILANRDRLPEGWEHINFTTWARVIPFGDFISDIYRPAKYLERPFSACAYLLSLSGAQKLLEKTNILYMPIDNYFSETGLVSFSLEPQVIALASLPSSIGDRPKYTKPKPKFWKRKHHELIEMLRAILVFLGLSSEKIVQLNKQLRKTLGLLPN